jgi:hypothetical protein
MCWRPASAARGRTDRRSAGLGRRLALDITQAARQVLGGFGERAKVELFVANAVFARRHQTQRSDADPTGSVDRRGETAGEGVDDAVEGDIARRGARLGDEVARFEPSAAAPSGRSARGSAKTISQTQDTLPSECETL